MDENIFCFKHIIEKNGWIIVWTFSFVEIIVFLLIESERSNKDGGKMTSKIIEDWEK